MNRFTKSIYIYTCGGLGNQLFQFAAGFSLARDIGASIHIDTDSGFASDKQFGRKFALNGFLNGHDIRASGFLIRMRYLLLITIAKIIHNQKFKKIKQPIYSPLLVTIFGPLLLMQESSPVYTAFKPLAPKPFIALHGYWQSHFYFDAHKEPLYKQIMQGLQFSDFALQFAEKLNSKPTLALGLRFYEETLSPELNAHQGKLKPIVDVATTLNTFIDKHQDVQIAVFCTHRSSQFKKLNLPANTLYLTGDDGFTSAADTLLLMMNCQHHLFLNSSLYWWGAWLSGMNPVFTGRSKIILAADNFINQSCYLDDWDKF